MTKRKTDSRPIDFRRLRDLVDAREVLRMVGWHPINSRGDNWRGPCPFHLSENPRSTSLSACRRVVRCFSCKWEGDGLAVWHWYKKKSLLQAAHDLCRQLGLDPPIMER